MARGGANVGPVVDCGHGYMKRRYAKRSSKCPTCREAAKRQYKHSLAKRLHDRAARQLTVRVQCDHGFWKMEWAKAPSKCPTCQKFLRYERASEQAARERALALLAERPFERGRLLRAA